MSSNKLKYFVVTQTSVVATNSKTDAMAIARGRRGVTGKLISEQADTVRISATEAKGTAHSDGKVMTA